MKSTLPAICSRIIFNNIFISLPGEQYLLMNLFSFRRTRLSHDEMLELQATNLRLAKNLPLSSYTDSLYFRLVREKQILSEETIKLLDETARFPMQTFPQPHVSEATFNLSYECNLNCSYCYQKQYEHADGYISENDVVAIQKFISNINDVRPAEIMLDNITITGGEPLLPKTLSTVLAILKHIPSRNYTLFTNGINIMRYRNQIPFQHFSHVQVSLDGLQDIITHISPAAPHNVFYTILDGIEHLLNCGCTVTINCMMSKGIMSWLESYIQQIEERLHFGDRRLSINIALPYAFSSHEIIDIQHFDLHEYTAIREYIRQSSHGQYIEIGKPSNFSRLSWLLFRPKNEKQSIRVKPCPSLDSIPVLFGPNGAVHWCWCIDPCKGRWGDYKECTIDESYLKQVQVRSVFSFEKCSYCDMRYICSGGCPIPNYVRGNPLLSANCQEFDNEYMVDHMMR